MKVYVATAFANKDVAREAMELVRAAGHEVTHDWTSEDASHLATNSPGWRAYLMRCGRADMDGILGCDALIVLAHPDMRDTRAEMGAAIARGIPVYVVNADAAFSVFYGYVQCVPSVTAALREAQQEEWRRLCDTPDVQWHLQQGADA